MRPRSVSSRAPRPSGPTTAICGTPATIGQAVRPKKPRWISAAFTGIDRPGGGSAVDWDAWDEESLRRQIRGVAAVAGAERRDVVREEAVQI